jgi:hypothetical protein
VNSPHLLQSDQPTFFITKLNRFIAAECLIVFTEIFVVAYAGNRRTIDVAVFLRRMAPAVGNFGKDGLRER